jgi:hypothetical protein
MYLGSSFSYNQLNKFNEINSLKRKNQNSKNSKTNYKKTRKNTRQVNSPVIQDKQQKSIYLYITLHGNVLTKNKSNNSNESNKKEREISESFRYVSIPSTIEHFTKISLGHLGCANYSNEIFDQCKINNVKKMIDKYQGYNLFDLFIDTLKKCKQHLTNNKNNRLNRRRFSHGLTVKNYYSEYVYNKGEATYKKLINKYFTNDEGKNIIVSSDDIPNNNSLESIESFESICQLTILKDSLGILTPDKISRIPYFNGEYITTQGLITILAKLGYTYIYLFDDSCNSIDEENIESHPEYKKFKKTFDLMSKSRKIYYF